MCAAAVRARKAARRCRALQSAKSFVATRARDSKVGWEKLFSVAAMVIGNARCFAPASDGRAVPAQDGCYIGSEYIGRCMEVSRCRCVGGSMPEPAYAPRHGC